MFQIHRYYYTGLRYSHNIFIKVLLGALVGGPDEFDQFVNNRTDYVRNEVALDYNAGITAISALMLDLERGNVGK